MSNKTMTSALRRAANLSKGLNSRPLFFSLTVGKRVICEGRMVPRTEAEYIALKSGKGVTATAVNEGTRELFGQISVQGESFKWGLARFGRRIDNVCLRVNRRIIRRIDAD